MGSNLQILLVDEYLDISSPSVFENTAPWPLKVQAQKQPDVLEHLLDNDNSTLPNLMILNIESDRKDYLTFFHTRQTHEPLRMIPVILIGPPLSQQKVRQLYQLGCNCYIERQQTASLTTETLSQVLSFWLGCNVLPHTALNENNTDTAQETREEQLLPTLRPLDVLLVDDDEGDIFLIEEVLSYLNLQVRFHAVRNGQEALDYLSNSADLPDLVLLDLNMPKMDGRQTLNAIRQNPALQHLPVLILTTSDAEADLQRSYRDGANAYLIKPVGIDKLVHMLKTTCTFWGQQVKLPENSAA